MEAAARIFNDNQKKTISLAGIVIEIIQNHSN